MSIDIHSEILETRDTRIKLLAEIEVLEEILEQINKMKKDAEIFLESMSTLYSQRLGAITRCLLCNMLMMSPCLMRNRRSE